MLTFSDRRRSWIVCVCLTAFFLLLSIFTMGISQGDDSWYLSDGVQQHLSHFIGLHYWSPLYIVWLRLLSFVCPDPVYRYFVSWALLTALLALIPVALKMRYAWIYTVLMIVPAVPTIYPYLGLFAGVAALLETCLVIRSRIRMPEALATACATCFFIAFARSEFDFGVLFAAAATLAAVVWEWNQSRKRRAQQLVERRSSRRLTVPAVIAVVLAATILVVMSRSLGSRSGTAFAQHFNRRAASHGLIAADVPSWQSNYVERAFNVDLAHTAANGTASLGDFFRANPKLFLMHIVSNIADPKTLLVLLAVIFAVAWPWTRPDGWAYRPASVFLGALVLPALMDMIVIYPRDHYVVILLPSVTLFALQWIRSERLLQPRVALVVIAGMVVMTYLDYGLPRLLWQFPTPEQMGLSQVNCMRQVDKVVPASHQYAFDSVGIRDVYLATPRTQVSQANELETWDAFKSWSLAKQPAWITVDVTLSQRYGVTPEQLASFLGGELGYVAHPCADRAHMTMYTPKGQ